MTDAYDPRERLEFLRSVQEGAPRVRPMTFGEWSREIELRKARGPIYPGVGMMGHLNTSSNAPTGPRGRPSGEQMVGWPGNQRSNPFLSPRYDNTQQYGVPGGGTPGMMPDKYLTQRPSQPPPWIDDVSMESIWYSPFQPVWPFGPPYYNVPREWNFPVGYNLNFIPERMGLYAMLREMRRSWGPLAAIEATRMDQLLRLPWTIQRRDKPRASSVGVDYLRRFFKRPDGKLSFGQWSRKLLFDLFDIDAPYIYLSRGTYDGKIQQAEVLDGATIFPLIDDAGRRPDTIVDVDEDGLTYVHRQPAFQQIIYGLPMINLSEDELIYAMMRPQPDLPMFGYSPVQQIFTEAMEGIRKTFYQLEFWRSGSMPELIVTVPDGWTPRHIATFQAHFDALLSGQLTLKSKVRFVPGGMKPFDVKNASGESLWSQRDELLVRLACYAFSVSPTPFVRQMNRGTAQTAQQTAQEEGLYPLMSWFKDDIMDRIIQDMMGFEDVEFIYLPRPEVDLEKQSKIHQVHIDEGVRSRNEVREELGQEPIKGGDIITVKTGTGVIPLDMVVSGEAAQLVPGAKSDGEHSKPPPAQTANSPSAQGSPMRGPPRAVTNSPQPTTVHKSLRGEIHDEALQAEKNPTPSQKEAGNYRKGHIKLHGLDITLETARGRERHGHTMDDKKWSSTMAGDYGYIRGTLGADGDQIDVCIGKHPKSDRVFVVDQFDTNTKQFDEHKVMLGYRKAKAALRDYLDSNGDGLGALRAGHMTELSLPEFKRWLTNGNHHQPLATQHFETLVKADTISTSTNLSWYSQTVPVRRRRKRGRKRVRRNAGPRWLELNA